MEPWKAGTPEIPASAATFITHAQTRIAAPASVVFRVLRNTETWRDWNRFVPRVTMSFQPPDTDDVTAAEIAELVHNTSIAGSVDSDITDGAAPGTHGLTGRRMSNQEEDDVRLQPPPVTRIALRRASAASGMSTGSGRLSGIGERPQSQSASRRATEANIIIPEANGGEKLSAVQKLQASRRASVASGQTSDAPPTILIESPNDPRVLVPAPPTDTAKEAEETQIQARRPSAVNIVSPMARRRLSINAIYGEPPVRIQVGTKMIFHCRMKIPVSKLPSHEVAIVVNEVSRPDDDSEVGPDGLVRTETHTLSRTGVYRIMWSMQQAYSPPRSFPKFLLQAQRVHEIRPVKKGDGTEECVYDDWECQRGALAGKAKKKYGKYLQDRFEEWGKGLGAYAEAMGGAVERRDFSVG
jgi:hypothetical protein